MDPTEFRADIVDNIDAMVMTQVQKDLMLLGLNPNGKNVTQDLIKAAYHLKARYGHPDKHRGAGEDRMQQATEFMQQLNSVKDRLLPNVSSTSST